MVHNDMQITILGMEQRKRARVTEIKYFANINTVWQTTQECILGEVKLVLLQLNITCGGSSGQPQPIMIYGHGGSSLLRPKH